MISLHVCGSDGCERIEVADDVMKVVAARRLAWADRYRDEHGDFPAYDEQVDYTASLIEEEVEAYGRRASMKASG